jgi:hypothetical protein
LLPALFLQHWCHVLCLALELCRVDGHPMLAILCRRQMLIKRGTTARAIDLVDLCFLLYRKNATVNP